MAFTSPPPHDSRRRGFTLIEALVAIAITAVLTTLAWPGMQSLIDRYRLQSASTRLAAHLQLARTTALVRNETVRVTVLPDTADGSCYLLHTGPASACSCAAGCSGTPALQTVAVPAHGRVRLEAPAASLRFDPQLGTCTPTATFKLAVPGGLAIHQVVNVLGRVRACSPQAKVPGHAAC